MAVKSEEKLTPGLGNDIMNMVKFHWSTWKSQSWDFEGVLLWALNLQKSYVS